MRTPAASPPTARRVSRSCRNRLPLLRQALRGPPRERLNRQRGVPRPAGAEHRSAEQSQIRRFVREATLVHDARFGVIAHAGAAVGVRAQPGPGGIALRNHDRARGLKPLLHLVLRVKTGHTLTVFWAARDANHRIAERIFYLRIEV